MSELTVDATSATPVYRQIVEQIRYLVEDGGLRPGDRLPPVRQLADNLGVNRNTVAKAYAMLRELQLIETRGASGTTIAEEPPRKRSDLREAVLAAVRGGMTPEEVRDAAYAIARQAGSDVRVVFAECNEERASAFAEELSDRLHAEVRPSLLTELDTSTADAELVVTTFFHLAEVRRWAHVSGREIETVAVVVAPHILTLMKVAGLPEGARAGVRYSTPHQAEQVRDWLAAAGRAEVVVVPSAATEPRPDLAMLVVPSEEPDLAAVAGPDTEVVEFGNVLDEGSIQMVGAVLDEIRSRLV
ncbi:GntR family transcriptional regulator [Pseudonocardia xinjiangensis]|uniref:GntR family transcriptional regulator n=1 Tax=Pseudonocardia xinjiangensis TaxID=75289 RepID=A0ABX1RBH4_9PSEU|nr:GntR family transcriptional regulator [Pseudonocardia xinjiangensis]NMH77743.1 GntR family transcriptional regulator [Pseudonocardia xinjiangensis]